MSDIKLPQSISGDGRTFVSQLSSALKYLSGRISAITNVLPPAQVNNLTVIEKWTIINGRLTNNLLITFKYNHILDYAYSEIYIKNSLGEYEYVDVAFAQYLYPEAENKEYSIKVVSVSKSGLKSKLEDAAEKTIIVTGVRDTISTPENINIEFNRNGTLVTWDKILDSDFLNFEVRENLNVGELGGLLGETTKTSLYITPTSRIGTIYIFPKNKSLFYGAPAIIEYTKPYPLVPKNITITKPRDKVVIQFSYIPDDCIGANLYINGDKYSIQSNVYEENITEQITSIQAAFTDTFGEGNRTEIFKVEPVDVTGFSVEPSPLDRSLLVFNWESAGIDISYEIRYGEEWNSAEVVWTKIKETTFQHRINTEGFKKFSIKAINMIGYDSANATSVSGIFYIKPDIPTNLTAVQEPRDRSMLKISWTASPGKDIAGYDIYVGGTQVATEKNTSYWWTIPASGTYQISVRARTVAGYVSGFVNTMAAVMIEAYDVTGFTASQMMGDRTKIRLMWDAPISQDVTHYEIRKGTNWDAGQIVDGRATGTFYDVIVLDELEHTFWIKAVTSAGKYSQNAAMISGIFDLNPLPVSNIVLSQDPSDVSVLNISWSATPESDLANYEIRKGYVWETAEVIGKTKELRWTTKLSTTNDVKIMIKSVNAAGFYSDEVSNNLYCTVEPSDVTGFRVFQNGERLSFVWYPVADVDVVSYELREGGNFDNGTIIADGITLNNYSLPVDTEILRRFHIKAINRAGYKSNREASVSILISDLPPKNVIRTYDEIALKSGTHSGTEFGQSQFTFATLPGKFSDYPTTKFSDIGGAEVLKLKSKELMSQKFKNGYDSFYTSGYYTDGIMTQASTEQIFNNGKTIKCEGSCHISSSFVEIDATKPVFGYVDVFQATAGIKPLYLGVEVFDANKVATEGNAGCEQYFGAVGTIVPVGVWKHYEGQRTLAIPSNTKYIRLRLFVNYYAPDLSQITYVGGIGIRNGDNLWGTLYDTSATYTCTRKDLGQIITANIATVFQPSILYTANTTATLEYRTSRDNITWTDWQPFQPVETTFRYVDFRVILTTGDVTQTPEVNQLLLRVDVPDTDIAKIVTVPVGGLVVNYNHTFYELPVVTPTASGTNRAIWTDKTKTSVKLQVLNSAGTDVGGQVDLRVKGY